ncbi:hypothetical protein K32_24070 [Kaistia sp. 32K]|uniref:hypothetical protein n=1 Tax=Kaistia sp. 32K TaxID=2795690 RepID=UPI001915E828|nr:hypothetical protein [Kaistia sp. 32K]BCP53790.1 hypothetical protein K32_24070 [Kaistia sp. 32K]
MAEQNIALPRQARAAEAGAQISKFLQPIWDSFCEAAWLAGKIPDRTVPVEWHLRKFERVDPLKDAAAVVDDSPTKD